MNRIAEVHYNVFKNRIEGDSVALMARNSTFSCDIATLSMRGIDRIHVLREGGVAPNSFTGSAVNAQRIVLTFGQYVLRCRQLRASVPDSSIVVEALELHPFAGGKQFFAESKFRSTRYRLVIPQCRGMGADFLGLLQGKIYRLRSAQIDGVEGFLYCCS